MVYVVIMVCGLVFKNVQTFAKYVCRPYNLPHYYHYYTSVSSMVLSYFEELTL